jgi:hypothetical protein
MWRLSAVPPCRPAIYDLRHTFATFALRAGTSTFDLSRYMGASLTMIDRHYGHLAPDGREHAIRLLDGLSAEQRPRWTLVDAGWTPEPTVAASTDNRNSETSAKQAKTRSPLTDSNRPPPPYHPQATGRNPRQRFSPF